MPTTNLHQRRLKSVDDAIRQLREKIVERDRQRERLHGHDPLPDWCPGEDGDQEAA